MKTGIALVLSLFVLNSFAEDRIPVKLKCLAVAYKGAFTVGADGNSIVWPDGERMVYDDGVKKDFNQALNSPAIADIFYQPYPVGFTVENGKKTYKIPALNEDPGRFRREEFYKKLYGNSESNVRRNVEKVLWKPTGKEINFQKKWGASAALRKLSDDLMRLAAAKPELKKFVENLGGTFYWRQIKNSNRLSFHSYATAMDINPDLSHYWEWDKVYQYRNRIPAEVVEVFERNKFIWGGKWYHYDTMHFEYRPEFFLSDSECIARFQQ